MTDRKKNESTAMVPTDTTAKKGLTQRERLALANAQEQLAIIKEGMVIQAELVDMALRVTTEADWDDMGARRGKPYSGQPRLNAKGAKTVRRIAQLEVQTYGSKLVEDERDKDGKLTYFGYECLGTVTSTWGPPMDCQGSCDSDNPFHSTRGYGDNRRKLPAHQVDRVKIRQQAQTLCVTRGITQYLGLEKLTWEEVKKYTSVDPNAAPRTAATFAQPQDKPDTPPPPDDPPPPSEADAPQAKPSIQQITAVKRMAKDAGVARDPVSWWEFVASTAGAEYGISEQQDENAAYACWTSDVVEKLKAEIVKRRQDHG